MADASISRETSDAQDENATQNQLTGMSFNTYKVPQASITHVQLCAAASLAAFLASNKKARGKYTKALAVSHNKLTNLPAQVH